MDAHGAKRAAEPNAYEQLAKKIWRPTITDSQLAMPVHIDDSPPPDSESLMEPSAAATSGFLNEVLNALYGDTTGHPENGSFSYHKAAEHYALSGDDYQPQTQTQPQAPQQTQSYAAGGAQKTQQPPPPGFERGAKALYDRKQPAIVGHSARPGASSAYSQLLPGLPHQQGSHGGSDLSGRGTGPPGAASINELSQLYLQLLQQQLPQQQAQQQQHLVAGASNNMSMPIYGMASGNANDITQVYAQLLAANLRQNATQHHQQQQLQHQQQQQQQHHHQQLHQQQQQQQQQHQQQQQQQQSSNAAAAAILYEAMLQQRALQHHQLQQQQLQQQQAQLQQQQQQQAQQMPRTPRGIYGGNFSAAGNKPPTPDNK